MEKRKQKEGGDKLARELKKLDSSITYGSRKASKEARPSTSKC